MAYGASDSSSRASQSAGSGGIMGVDYSEEAGFHLVGWQHGCNDHIGYTMTPLTIRPRLRTAYPSERLMLSLRLCLLVVAVACVIWMSLPGRVAATPEATERARKYLEKYTAKIRPLEIAVGRAW